MDDLEIPTGFCNGCGVCCQGELNGLIERPFLTSLDIENIIKETGLQESDFVDNVFIAESNIKVLRTKPKGEVVGERSEQSGKGCMFFDDETRRCKIYRSRPLDCRLFPLDIAKEDEKYYLILYTDVCPVDVDLISEPIKPAMDKILPLLKDYIHEYITLENGIEKSKRWKKVAKIRENWLS